MYEINSETRIGLCSRVFAWFMDCTKSKQFSENFFCWIRFKGKNVFFSFFVFLLQSPPKGATIPYRPKPQINTPVLLANGQAYTIQGSYVPAQEVCTQQKSKRCFLVLLSHTKIISICFILQY